MESRLAVMELRLKTPHPLLAQPFGLFRGFLGPPPLLLPLCLGGPGRLGRRGRAGLGGEGGGAVGDAGAEGVLPELEGLGVGEEDDELGLRLGLWVAAGATGDGGTDDGSAEGGGEASVGGLLGAGAAVDGETGPARAQPPSPAAPSPW